MALSVLDSLAQLESVSDYCPSSNGSKSSLNDRHELHDDTENDQKAPNSLKCKKENWSIIGRLSAQKAASWNEIAKVVYHAFKVTPYIVQPDYILSASTQQEFGLTVNSFLQMTAESRYPSWHDVEHNLEKLLKVYKGCEDIPNLLHETDSAAKLMRRNFRNNLFCAARDTYALSAFNAVLDGMGIFCDTFIQRLEDGRLTEDLFVWYLHDLINFYCWTTQVPISLLPSTHSLTLDLSSTIKPEGCVMNVRPDFQLRLKRNLLLVGEVKTLKKSEIKKSPQMKDPVKNGQPTGRDEPQPGSISEDEGHTKPSGSLPKEDGREHSGTVEALNADSQKTSENRNGEAEYFRKLDRKENLKVDCFLPELLAGLLAAMDCNREMGCNLFAGIGCNECVQMGFSVEDFKVRFVKLALCHANSNSLPTIVDIRSPNVRCDVFLTQELNLFKPSHIKMFFQILHAIAHASRCGS